MRDKAYLAWIRSTVCLVCQKPNPQPHHCPPKANSSIALKTSDYRTIGLCFWHHSELHQHGRDTFAKKYGIDYEHAISELLRIYQERINHDARRSS